MKTMKWLIRREFWENKGAIFWAPVWVSLILVLSMGGSALYALFSNHLHGDSLTINGHAMSFSSAAGMMTAETKAELANVMANGYMLVSLPLFLMMAVIVVFYCLAALYDERRDRSILFWKSLPVSDQMTVLSKAALALCVAPAITSAVAITASTALLLIACAGFAVEGINLAGALLSNSALYLAPLRIIGLLPVYLLWALPSIGWFMMVSSWARSKVFLWAIGAPLLALGLLQWADRLFGFGWDIQWFGQHIVGHGLGGVLPGLWLTFEHVDKQTIINPTGHMVDLGGVFTQSWLSLGSADLWGGVVAGVAMLLVAVRMRRWRDES